MSSVTLNPAKALVKINARAEQLVMVNLSNQPVESWLQAMRDAGQPWHQQELKSLIEAKAMLQAEPGAHVLICHDAPEVQIEHEIGLGRAPSQALANWQNVVEPLLALYHEHYQRITLVESEALFTQTKALSEQLSKRSGLALGRVKVEAPAITLDKHAEWLQASRRLLALQALSHSSARKLVQELSVSSLPLLESAGLLEQLDSLFDLHRTVLEARPKDRVDISAQQALQAKLDDLQQENDLIIEQLHKTQEELEQFLLGNNGNSAKVAKLERDIKRKNEKLHAFSQKSKRLAAQLKEARQQLKALRQSKSWKVTAPMRKVIKLLGGGKQRSK